MKIHIPTGNALRTTPVSRPAEVNVLMSPRIRKRSRMSRLVVSRTSVRLPPADAHGDHEDEVSDPDRHARLVEQELEPLGDREGAEDAVRERNRAQPLVPLHLQGDPLLLLPRGHADPLAQMLRALLLSPQEEGEVERDGGEEDQDRYEQVDQ